MKKVLLHVAEVVLESAVGAIGGAVVFTDVDWRVVVSTATFAGATGFIVKLKKLIKEKNRKQIELKGECHEKDKLGCWPWGR